MKMSLKVFLSLALSGFLVGATVAGASVKEDKKREECAALLSAGLSVSEAYIIQMGAYLRTYKRLPKFANINTRLIQLTEEPSLGLPEQILAEYGITEQEWRDAESVEFERSPPALGSRTFQKAVDDLKRRAQITSAQAKTLSRLNLAADTARAKVKTALLLLEETSLPARGRLMTEGELEAAMRNYTHNPKYTLTALMNVDLAEERTPLQEWRYRLLISRSKIRDTLLKSYMEHFKDMVISTKEIPESDDETIRWMAGALQTTPEDMRDYFGPGMLGENVTAFIDEAIRAGGSALTAYVNRRIYTAERTQNMLDAIRGADNIVLFKLAENQDLGDFNAVVALAEGLNAPIIVSPAFSEVGLIPTRLKYLFDHPRVHVLIDPILQLTKDFYVVNNGAPDKLENPMVGLERLPLFGPTSSQIVMSPRVLAKTRASGSYDAVTAYMMTTGSMSIPSYRSEFNVGMVTDFRAQQTALANRGLTVLSRRYPSQSVGTILGSAFGMGARRVPFAQERFGNPAGLFDINKLYTDNGVVELQSLPAVIWPDIHLGDTDPANLQALFDHLLKLNAIIANPRYGQPGEFRYIPGPFKIGALILHDGVNGDPFNHHIMDRIITRSLLETSGKTDIERHFSGAAAFMNQLAWILPDTTIIVPADNHGYDWIKAKLESGDLWESRGSQLAVILRLMLDQIKEGGNPYERLLSYYGVNLSRVRFIDPQGHFRIGVDLKNPNRYSLLQGAEGGQHTHMGVNGSKSISIKGLLSAYGAIAGGHQHSTQEEGQAKRVGSATPTVQGYHRGPSTNDVSLAEVYGEDAIQLLRLVKGSFLPSTTESQAPDRFFPPGFPLLEGWPKLIDGGLTTDQYRAFPPVTRYRRF